MAAQSTLKNMVLSLTLVCLVCSALLGAVYVVTLKPIAAASQKTLTEALSLVLLPQGDIDTQPREAELDGVRYECYTQSLDGERVAVAVKSTVNGFGGPLTVLVGVSSEGVVLSTKVLSHSETPGLGAKCQTDEAFIAQFEGFDPAERRLAVTKDGGDVDAITASTITSRAYTLAVQNAVNLAAYVTSAAGLPAAIAGPENRGNGPSMAQAAPAASAIFRYSIQNLRRRRYE